MLLQTSTMLDNATLALAIVTGILALATIGTAIAALWLAKSSAASVGRLRKVLAAVLAQAKLTDDQLKVTNDEVKRARHEFFAARLRALAKLHVDGSFDDQGQLSGHVTYESGNDAAYNVRVWTRHNRITHGLPCGTLTPTRNDFPFVFPAVGPDMSDNWPFPETPDLPANELQCFYLGVTWRDIGESLQRWLVQKSGDGPPKIILDDVALDSDSGLSFTTTGIGRLTNADRNRASTQSGAGGN